MAWDPVFQFSVTWDNISNKPASFPGMWDAPNDANYYVRSGGEWEAIDVPAIIENYLVWGNIGGSLINQSDLWNTMVRTSGNQEAAGTKTWTGPAVFTKTANADSLVVERTGGTARNAHIHYKTDVQSVYTGIGNVSDSIFCIGTDINLTSNNSPFQFNLANGVLYAAGEMRGGSARFDGITSIRSASNANRRLVFLESDNTLASEIVGTSDGGMWIGGLGNIVIRPNGTGSSAGQTVFYPNGNVSTSGTISDTHGDVRKLKFVTANSTTSLGANTLNGVVEKTNNSSYTYTIPAGLGSRGDAITFVNSGTGGNITINRGSNVTLYRNGTNANITVGPGSIVTIYRSNTNNRWIA